MTADIASLGIAVDTTQVKAGTAELDKLGDAGERAATKVKTSNAAFTQFNDSLTGTEREAKRAADAAARLAAEQQALGTTTNTLTIGQQMFMDKLRDQAAAAGLSKTRLLELQAASMGLTGVSTPLIAQIEAATKAQTAHGFSMASSTAKVEVARIAHDAMIGSYSRMGSAMLVLGNATGATALLMNPLTLGLFAVAGAAAFVAIEMAKGRTEQIATANALLVTSNYASMTAESMRGLAEDMTKTKEITIGTANAIVYTLVSSGRIGGDAVGLIAKMASDFAKATGEDIDKITPKLVKMFEDPIKGAEELNKSMHFLTTTQLEHIASLERTGQVQAAQLELAKLTTDHMPKQAANVGYLAHAYNDLRDALTGVIAAMNHWGEQDSTSGQIATLKKTIKELNGKDYFFAGDNAIRDRQVIALQNQVVQLQSIEAHEKQVAAASKAAGEANEKQANSWNAIKANSGAYHIQELQDRLKLINLHQSEAGPDYAAQEAAKVDAIRKTNKEILDAYRNMGAEARGLTQGQIAGQEALRQANLKYAADNIEAQHKLGLLTKQEFDFKMNGNALDAVSSKMVFEQQMLQVRGLTAAEKQRHRQNMDNYQVEIDRLQNHGANQQAIDQKKSYDDTLKSIIAAGTAESTMLDAEIAKQRLHNDEIGKTIAQKDLLIKRVFDEKTAQLESDSAFITNAIKEAGFDEMSLAVYRVRIGMLDREIAQRRELSRLKGIGATNDAAVEQQKIDAQQFKDAISAAKEMEVALTASFGNIGKSIGQMSVAFADYGKTQHDIQEKLKKDSGDPLKAIGAETKARQDGASAQIKYYGDLASAAKGFFDKNSTGYKIMEGLEKEMRIIQMATQMEKLYTSLFVTATTTSTEVAGQAVVKTAVIEAEAAKNLAKVPGVFMSFMSAMGPWGAAAAAVAVAAVLGGALGGGGVSVDTTAKDRQAAAGTGSVLGDDAAKSESMKKSIDMLEKNSSITLPITQAMLVALHSIRDNIQGMAALVVQSTGLTGTYADKIAAGESSSSGFLGIGSTTRSLVDQGIQLNANQSIGSVRRQGIDASSYSAIRETDSGFWGLGSSDETHTQTGNLNQDIKDAFSQTIVQMRDGVLKAAESLGVGGDAVIGKIDSMSLGLSNISLKDMKGTDIPAYLESILSKFGDDMTKLALPQLAGFQHVGEGMFETATRVVTGIETTKQALEKLGLTMISYTGILNKQGDVGAELARQSIRGCPRFCVIGKLFNAAAYAHRT